MRSPHERLRDIVDAIAAVERYVVRGREAYDRDELVPVWMVHHIQLIGEAARALPEAVRTRAPAVPWHLIIGMRHVLAHDYFAVDRDEVWNTATRDLPPLREAITVLLRELSEGTHTGG